MSSALDVWERKKRLGERKRRREKDARQKQEQEEEEEQKQKKGYRPYAWREILKRKDRPKPSSPSIPEHSTTKKYAKTESPVQKLLRQSSSSKVKASPSTQIDPKWISRSNKNRSRNQKTNKHSDWVKNTEESPQKVVITEAAAKMPPPAADMDSDNSDSEVDLLAYMRGGETNSEQQESRKSASDEENGDSPAKTSSRKRSRGSMNCQSSSEDEDGRRSQACHKLSRHELIREYSRADSDSLSEEDTESQPQRSNQKKSALWPKRKSQEGGGILFSSEDESEECSVDFQRKSRGSKPKKKKSTRKHSEDDDSDVCSDDENIRKVSSRRDGHRGTNQGRRKGKNSKYKSRIGSSSDEEEKPASRKLFSSSSDDSEADMAKKPVLNPFTVAQQEQQSFEAIAACCARSEKKTDDDLWSDMDDDVDNKEADKSKSKRNKKRSGSKSTRNSNESKRSLVSSPSPTTKGPTSYWYLPDTEKRYEISKLLAREDEEALQRIIHPEIENPVWKFENEALELGKGSESAASVPASLSRYLAPYQKEGIRFMHKCLTAKSGTIMGDEMGLGKTVQVIALLCALFEKTGTGLDLLRIHRRNKLIMQQREVAIREEQKATLEGRIYMPKKIDAKSLDLPVWYPVLIVVPPSVVENWKNEFERFGNFAVAIFSGSREVRDRALDMIRDGRAEVLIAAKSLFQEKRGANLLNEISWKLVIIDEFHTFKNVNGKVSKHLRMVKADHQPLILGMTGTLMQNDHKELWNLIDLVETNYLGTWKEFEAGTARAIKLGRQKGANDQTIASCKRKSKALEEHLAKLFIARSKEDVAADKLTKKTVSVVFCPLSEIQKRVYANILTLPDVQVVKMATSPCDCGVNKAIFKRFFKLQRQAERVRFIRENQKDIMTRRECCYKVPLNPRRNEEGQPLIDPDAVIWRMLDGHDENSDDGCIRCPYCVLFSVLDKLNKLSSHVGSLQADRLKGTARRGSPEYVRFTKELQFAKVAFPPDVIENLPGGLYRQDAVMNEHFLLSGKMKELHRRLKQYKKENCKVLVFSYSTKTLDFIQQYARSENHSFLRIDGQVQAKLRQDLCNRFNKDRNVFLFLLSTKACGLGLNLTAANKVIIFDVEWNPSWDEQAQDRAYRIGQQNDVEVIRLVSEGTVDELRYLRQLYKVQLKNETLKSSEAKARSARVFRGIQGDRDRKGELFGTENLLKLKEDGSFLADVWKSKMPSGKCDTPKEDDITSNLSSDLCDKLFDPDSANAAVAYVESQRDNGEYDTDSEDEKMHPSAGNRQGQDGDKEDAPTAIANSRSEQQQDDRQASGQVDEESSSQRVTASRREVIEVSDTEYEHIANAVNQDALYDEEQGGALYEEGDDGYDEEMGGNTQNAYASYATMQLPENPQDGTLADGSDEEGGNHNPNQNNAQLAAVPQRHEAIPAGIPRMQRIHMREAMHQMEDAAPRRQVADFRALDERTQGGRQAKEEGQSIRRNSESRTSIQLRPEPEDPSKEDFFRSRDARGGIDGGRDDVGGSGVTKKPMTHCVNSDGDNATSGARVSKRPKADNGDSDESAKKPPKKKAPINLFGKTTTASKSNSKGSSAGLSIPTYKKSRRKKKK